MKKVIISSIIAIASAAHANVDTSIVRDYGINQTGVRIATGLKVGSYDIEGTVTHIDDAYTRVGVGKKYQLVTRNKLSVNASVGGVYQDTRHSSVNGLGLSAGLGAQYALTNNISAIASVEGFVGQDRIGAFDGNTVAVGLKVKF